MQQDNEFAAVCRALRQAKQLAVLTGAGISAESGLATFRGSDGLWCGRYCFEPIFAARGGR